MGHLKNFMCQIPRKRAVCFTNKSSPNSTTVRSFEFQILPTRIQYCTHIQYTILTIGNNRKKGNSAPSCVQCATRDDSSNDGASTHASRVCTHVLCTLVRSYDRCLEIYITPQRHCRTEKRVPGAHARSMSVSVF